MVFGLNTLVVRTKDRHGRRTSDKSGAMLLIDSTLSIATTIRNIRRTYSSS